MKYPHSWKKGETPSFWLLGLSKLYKNVQCIYEWFRTPTTPFRMHVPVMSIGGVTLGGAGKTPCVLALAKALKEKGYQCIILTRGYKGTRPHPSWVHPKDSPAMVGEEAWIMAQHFPVFTAKNIVQGAKILNRYINEKKNSVILWDDGHQYPKLHKDIALVVTTTTQCFGNKCLFPAGPLREELTGAIERAQAVLCLYFNAVEAKIVDEIRHTVRNFSLPVWPVLCKTVCSLPEQTNVVGFCGLGDPDRFYTTLEQCKLNIKAYIPFPDHHMYTKKNEEKLLAQARVHNAVLITSHKDYVKLSPYMQKETYQILQSLELDSELVHFLEEHIKEHSRLSKIKKTP